MPLTVPEDLFLRQAQSDYKIFLSLKGEPICHRLHYLQMSTEKLAKAYFWRKGSSPGFNHHKFVPFLRDLDLRPDLHKLFGYINRQRFQHQKQKIFDLARDIEKLAPAGGNIGPNPEYPWPPSSPGSSPLSHAFQEWQDWNVTTAGRRLKVFVENVLWQYQVYFP